MADGLTISLVVGSFHQASCEIMVKKARSTARGLGLQVRDEVWVPGSMEKPLATKRLLERSVVDAVVVLGIICLLYTSPSPRDVEESRMPSTA